MLKQPILKLCLLAILAAVIVSIASCLGDVNFSPVQILSALFSHKQSMTSTIITQLRIPRIIAAFTTGALLALAGCLMQVLLKNPLADPYILGVSGGAAIMNILGILLGLSTGLVLGLSYLGAIVAILLLVVLARGQGAWSTTRLLLTGVVLASGFGAVISFILSISPNQTIHTMLFWLIGNLSGQGTPYLGLLVLLIGFIVSFSIARSLNILKQSELMALSLGLNTKNLNIIIFLLSALLTATAVSIAGTVGFVGLVIPHILRLYLGSDHRYIIPGSILAGGSLLCLADVLARLILAPIQLPVGIFTAFLGVPIFLYLLARSYR